MKLDLKVDYMLWMVAKSSWTPVFRNTNKRYGFSPGFKVVRMDVVHWQHGRGLKQSSLFVHLKGNLGRGFDPHPMDSSFLVCHFL